uniref:Uncharacterized protein n=1 Tax=Solanum tuberosum TaxID=4113 RepID=M1DSI9_SOLTU
MSVQVLDPSSSFGLSPYFPIRSGKWESPIDSAIRLSSGSSPFYACLQHLCVLDHGSVYFYFAELIGDTPNAPFIAFLILFLQGFAYRNKGRSMSSRRFVKCAWRCSGFSFFILYSIFVPFCA